MGAERKSGGRVRILAISRPTARFTPAAAEASMAAEVSRGRAFYRDGLIEQAYMKRAHQRAYLLLEAESVPAAKSRFDTYPPIADVLMEFAYTPLPAWCSAER
jgi:hypothetical protein